MNMNPGSVTKHDGVHKLGLEQARMLRQLAKVGGSTVDVCTRAYHHLESSTVLRQFHPFPLQVRVVPSNPLFQSSTGITLELRWLHKQKPLLQLGLSLFNDEKKRRRCSHLQCHHQRRKIRKRRRMKSPSKRQRRNDKTTSPALASLLSWSP